jgi:hypothetical protein
LHHLRLLFTCTGMQRMAPIWHRHIFQRTACLLAA